MKNRILLLLLSVILTIGATGCGVVEDPKIAKFKNDIQSFCDEIAALNANINNIDPSSPYAADELLDYLDQLDQAFKVLSTMSIPEEYAYLKELTLEASTYMTTAVESYHEAFADNSYDANIADYARQNYERAYKRVTVMLKLLRGETITEDGVVIEQEN